MLSSEPKGSASESDEDVVLLKQLELLQVVDVEEESLLDEEAERF